MWACAERCGAPRAHMATTPRRAAVLYASLIVLAGCGQRQNPEAAAADSSSAGGSAAAVLTPEQMRDGIGPAKGVTVSGTIDAALAKQGEELFTTKCSACHRLDRRYVGPALGEVTQRRTPTYVLNMILNPTEMTQKHPVAHELLAKHMTQMPALGLTEAQARAVLEYLRKNAQPETGGTT
jgi:cytochrome c